MSVLINMEMPESCDDCILNNGITCYAVPDYREDGVVGRTDDRPDWCPLVPAADVRTVVRCKDCRHRDPEDHKCDSGETERQGCPFKVADDYFCAYGER